MARLDPRPRLRIGAGEARGRPRVDDLLAAADQRPHRRLVHRRLLVEQSGEMAGPMGLAPARQRPPFGLPFLNAAIEQRDSTGAENAKHPPGPRGAVKRAVVVDDYAVAVADPERLHPAPPLGPRGARVRPGG